MTRYKGSDTSSASALRRSAYSWAALRVVDRAWPDYHEEAVVGAVENVTNDFAALVTVCRAASLRGDFALELIGRDQGLVGFDVQVVDR
jgi:hypothetical protein